MAYNLQPLITILEQILNHPQQTLWIVDHNKPPLQSLLERAASLRQILEKSSLPKIEILESRIRDAAHKAEDIIESNMVDQIISRHGGVIKCSQGMIDLHQVMQELDAVMEQVVERTNISSGSSWSGGGASLLSSKSVVVGVDEDLMQLKDRLIGMQSKLEIIPIVGMGGIGKTTLARQLYNDPLINYHFESRAWTTISQDYNMRVILLGLLGCIIGKEVDKHIEKKNNELEEILYKSLYGRRYMIVLDDIWSTKFWDDIRRYLPDNNNGSRIVITTRESDVAKHADSQSLQHQVQLLTKSESWNLLHQIVFGEEDCSASASASDVILQEIGRKIASDCGGLPLTIHVIGGLLSKVERSRDVWENIGNDVRAALVESDEQFSNILCLSYNHLPNHLKPCFLYMGAFPEDYEIKASRLIRMWVAEGFLKSNGDKSLEEDAEDYLKALVERNLLLVKDYECNGKPKRYIMHDLLRDLCMRKAEEEKFLHVIKNGPGVTFSNLRRVSVDTSYASAELMPLARSFLCTENEILSPVFFALRLLRVLDVMEMSFEEFPKEIFQLVNLRYLAISCNSCLPAGISRLLNLQTLIASLEWGHDVPCEIWEMSELRHLKLDVMILINVEYIKKFVQKKLQTISLMRLTPALMRNCFFESIPNIKELGIYCDILPCSEIKIDLSHLHKLETLRCISELDEDCRHFLPMLRFPFSLRKLSLVRCVIFPTDLTSLCGLPNLEVLKIKKCVFESERDEEWDMTAEGEGDEFRSLQFLSVTDLDVVRWRADKTNFPRLRHLLVAHCSALQEIPSGIGEIPTLQLIELEDCNTSLVASAKQIQEEQQSEFDNYDLKLHILNY